jgi:hypothetical protein
MTGLGGGRKPVDPMRKMRTMGYGAELMDGELFALPDDLVRPEG